MSTVTWSEPEDRRRRASQDFGPIAAELLENPGQWGVIADGLDATRTQASSLALGVRRGKYSAFKPAGAWLSRSSADKVWAKYVGEDLEYATEEEKQQVIKAREQAELKRLETERKRQEAETASDVGTV